MTAAVFGPLARQRPGLYVSPIGSATVVRERFFWITHHLSGYFGCTVLARSERENRRMTDAVHDQH
jgi:hypothetical protein